MSVDPAETETVGAAPPARPARGIALAVAAAAVVVLILVAVLAFGASSTVACSSCHSSQAVALGRTPHTGIGCARCHSSAGEPFSSRLDVLFRMGPASVGGVRLDGPGRPVGSASCVDCHPKVMSGGTIAKNGLRIDHSRCAVGAECASCHGQAMHGKAMRLVRNSSMTACVACHTARGVPVGCSTCHQGRLPSDRVRDPEFVRLHGPDWRTVHGTGDLSSCTGCHATEECSRCHHVDLPHPADFGASHGAAAKKAGVDACMTCHKRQAYCDGCHGIRMPHPTGFLQAHSRIATSSSDPKCTSCHAVDDCQTCHEYHIHPGGVGKPYTLRGWGG